MGTHETGLSPLARLALAMPFVGGFLSGSIAFLSGRPLDDVGYVAVVTAAIAIAGMAIPFLIRTRSEQDPHLPLACGLHAAGMPGLVVTWGWALGDPGLDVRIWLATGLFALGIVAVAVSWIGLVRVRRIVSAPPLGAARGQAS